MIFSELYSAYYNAMAKIISIAIKHPLTKDELRRIVEQNAFGESVLTIESAIAEEHWQLINNDGTTPIKQTPTMPLTTLQKSWINAIYLDPRIRLFTDEKLDYDDVEPLFTPSDVLVFDKYADGDPYGDEDYIKRFRLILDAIKNKYALSVDVKNRHGKTVHSIVMPHRLEYSEKDDKFRLIGGGNKYNAVINLARIVSCKRYDKPCKFKITGKSPQNSSSVVFELTDERNALERVLLHFAHFKKQAERLEDNKYKVTIYYDSDDETELVIRVLSFGPMIKVTEPEYFVNLIKDRLLNQKSCEF